MILDIQSVLSNNQTITATATSTAVYDTAGVGVGVAAPNISGSINGTAVVFGQDIGGGGPNASAPQLMVFVGTAFTAGGSATMQVQLQCAVDSGGGTPGTWDTIVETDTIAVALLTAGQFLAKYTVPTRYPGQGFPRFYRVNYVVATGPMLTGTINASLLTGIDDEPAYPANY